MPWGGSGRGPSRLCRRSLRHSRIQTRMSGAVATNALGRIGPGAEPAVPTLIAAILDPDAVVQDTAVTALREIGPAAVPALIAALKDETRMSGKSPPIP